MSLCLRAFLRAAVSWKRRGVLFNNILQSLKPSSLHIAYARRAHVRPMSSGYLQERRRKLRSFK
jgi:hypothetical protein